jgi:hypothetical protein
MTDVAEILGAARPPLIAYNRRWPGVLHAVSADEIHRAAAGWPHWTMRAVCGAQRLRAVLAGELIGQWPPRVRSLPRGWTRCQHCHRLTGRQRPRTTLGVAR